MTPARKPSSDTGASGPVSKLQAWFLGRLPDHWFEGPPEITFDRDEILVVGTLAEPTVPGSDAAKAVPDNDDVRTLADQARIARFREETRVARMQVADEAEERFGRKVAWGARCGDRAEVFTNLSVPVMTRLRLTDRQVLDTLVDGGVARSRSHALAWCVRLVGEHQEDWITQLRDALVAVEQVRSQGPSS